MGNFPSFFRHLFKKLAFQLVKDLSCPSSCNFLSSQGILDGNANIASLVPFSFWGPHSGTEPRRVAGSRKPDGGHLRPCLEDALGPVGVPLSVGLLLPVLISADVTATWFTGGMPTGNSLYACFLSFWWNHRRLVGF